MKNARISFCFHLIFALCVSTEIDGEVSPEEQSSGHCLVPTTNAQSMA